MPGAARVDGNVNAFGVFVVSKDGKVVSGFGPPAIGGNWSDAPAGHGLQGLAIIEGHEPHGPDEVVFDERTAERAGYVVGDQVDIIPSTAVALPTDGQPTRARPDPARAGRASRASRAEGRSTARRTPPSTPRPPRTSSSTARTPTPTSG